jgi:cytochrome c biogenesis protein CcmG/thiol:disulfide interchange protein DsbE
MGSVGVPETFIIDGKGVIRFQHIGPIKPEDVPGIMDKLEEVR